MTHATPQSYQSLEELKRILWTVGEWNCIANAPGYFHPGYIQEFLSHTLGGLNSSRHFFFVEAADGSILAVIMLHPLPDYGYDLLVNPVHRGGELEIELIVWAENQLITMLAQDGTRLKDVGTDVLDCDTMRAKLLIERGYVSAGRHWLCYDNRSLLEPIFDSELPEGFTIRSVAGEYEHEALRLVHNLGLNSDWKPGEYLAAMRTPCFEIDHELVVVATDGQFAAFLIYWIDPVSRQGLFEPVACHEAFRRQGLTKALMVEGMRRMKAEGAVSAVLKHEVREDNPAACALYISVGFKFKYGFVNFRKTLT